MAASPGLWTKSHERWEISSAGKKYGGKSKSRGEEAAESRNFSLLLLFSLSLSLSGYALGLGGSVSLFELQIGYIDRCRTLNTLLFALNFIFYIFLVWGACHAYCKKRGMYLYVVMGGYKYILMLVCLGLA